MFTDVYIGLIVDCPNRTTELSCPFMGLREQDIMQRIEEWKIMPEEDKQKLINQHQNGTKNVK